MCRQKNENNQGEALKTSDVTLTQSDNPKPAMFRCPPVPIAVGIISIN